MARTLTDNDEQNIRKACGAFDLNRLSEVLGLQDGPVPAPDDPKCLFALFLAAYDGRREIVELLMDKGLDVNLRAPGIDWPALEIAAKNSHLELVELMLSRGAEPDVRNHIDCTPLMSAAHNGRTECARVLLDYGADVDAKSHSNYTAIGLACKANHPATVKLLLEAGADRDVPDRDGWRPIDYALEEENLSDPSNLIHARDPELAQLLRTFYPTPKQKTAIETPRAAPPRLVVPKPTSRTKLLPRKPQI